MSNRYLLELCSISLCNMSNNYFRYAIPVAVPYNLIKTFTVLAH